MLISFIVLLIFFAVGCIVFHHWHPINKYPWYYLAAMVMFLPASVYLSQFWNHPFSEDPNMWGVFGDYIGGVYNVLSSILIAVITYRLSKMKTSREHTAEIANDILSQIDVMRNNHYHHKSVTKFFSMVRKNEFYFSELLKNSLYELHDSYTRHRVEKIPINDGLEKSVIKQLKRMAND